MKNPRVAVVIPCYNDGAFLPEALESVDEQEPCETIVVDDGSDDPATLHLLAELDRSDVRVVRQENRGLSRARMSGVHIAEARYVHPLDADDRLAAGALTSLADALDANSDVEAAWGDTRSFGVRSRRYPKAHSLDPWRITYLDEVPATVLVRRDALIRIGGWDLGTGYEDWDFWMKAAEHGWRGHHVPRVTLLYREHSNPRMYSESRERHGALYALLRDRHPALFAARRRNRRLSPSTPALKLLFPLIDAIPALPRVHKENLWVVARNRLEPWMVPDGFAGVPTRIAVHLRRLARSYAGRASAG